MKRTVILLIALTAGPVFADPADDVDYGHKKFEVWRQYPDHLAKLRGAAQAFASLPAERRSQLQKLDHDLALEPSQAQARLQNTLDRYNEWLGKLPDKDQERIRRAPNSDARLAIVKELRQNEWLRGQAKATQVAMAALPNAARDEAIAKARTEERLKLAEWTIARRFWDDLVKNRPLPTKAADLDLVVQNYVADVLMRLLSKDERDRLAKAEGKWPMYPQTLVELADAHPPALARGPATFAELPKLVRDALSRKTGPKDKGIIEKRVKASEGNPHQFAMKLTSLAAENGVIMPLEWWVYNSHGLNPPMKTFLDKLEPMLDRNETRQLVEATGKWPDYPETIQKLAQAHHLDVPWFTLPGNRERWDAYRPAPPLLQGFPDLPRYKLRDFATYDLEEIERLKLKTKIDRARGKPDEAWRYLVELYFQRYPDELARLRQVDRERK